MFDCDRCSRAGSLIGLFDGHGGRGTVDFVSHALPRNLRQILCAKKRNQDESDDEFFVRALRAAFLLTDIQSKNSVVDRGSGATGVCCMLRPKHARNGESTEDLVLHVANCGDSRAVLCHEGRALRLTYDHKGEDNYEHRRLAKANGFTHAGRTLGILAVSRSFGDHAFKEFVTADPHVVSRQLSGAQIDPFLIICCDGVWDVISDGEACVIVSGTSEEQKTDKRSLIREHDAAKRLVEEALRRGCSDTVSAVVVFF